MLQQRQKLILQLLQALGGDVANTDFQKLLFLFTREFQDTPVYDFVPYKYGGFSFTSYADKRRLSERGLLEDGWVTRATGDDGRNVIVSGPCDGGSPGTVNGPAFP